MRRLMVRTAAVSTETDQLLKQLMTEVRDAATDVEYNAGGFHNSAKEVYWAIDDAVVDILKGDARFIEAAKAEGMGLEDLVNMFMESYGGAEFVEELSERIVSDYAGAAEYASRDGAPRR